MLWAEKFSAHFFTDFIISWRIVRHTDSSFFRKILVISFFCVRAVIAKQQISVSTPQILRQINYEQLEHLDNERLIASLKAQDWQEAVKYMGNVLEPVTMSFYPEIKQLKDKMVSLGADVAQMSGTGPTVFAVCHTESRAKRIQNSISGFCRDVHVVTLL